MNLATIGQFNVGFLTGPQTNAAVLAQGSGWLNAANVQQANLGFGSGPQTNVAVVSQGH